METDSDRTIGNVVSAGWVRSGATIIYIAFIALLAQVTGLFYILFPELGALSHDIFKRPRGTWARAPLLLIVTPFLTAMMGTLVTRTLPYGPVSVLLTVGGAIAIIRLLRSPIAPAISAGLLPLVLGVKDWRYPPSILLGAGLLAAIILIRKRLTRSLSGPPITADSADDIVEQTPADYSWIPFFFLFLALALVAVWLTGWRFLLYPPLVVIAFEMFAHPSICPWAGRPLTLPIACMFTAGAGVAMVGLFGAGPLAAALSIIAGILILRIFDLHVPPALAVGLLPMVMAKPDDLFPIAVGIGTALLTISFLVWRRMQGRAGRA